jgi:hypothetical protein
MVGAEDTRGILAAGCSRGLGRWDLTCWSRMRRSMRLNCVSVVLIRALSAV